MSLVLQRDSLPVPLQIIVIDDCSGKEGLKRFCDTFNIEYHKLGEHQGVQIARNVGRSLVDTEYIVFSDADVLWFGGALNSLFRTLLREENVAYAYGNYHRHGDLRGEFVSGPFSGSRLRSGPFISTMSLVRTSALPSPAFVEDEERLQDWSLWLRMLNDGHIGAFVDKVLFTTQFCDTSISCRGPEDYEHWKSIISRRYNPSKS